MKIVNSIFILFVLSIFYSSCNKYLEIDPPRDQLINESVFKSENSSIAAVLGIYQQMADNFNGFAFGATTQIAGLSADELDYFLPNAEREEFETNAVSPNNSTLSYAFWKPCYQYIYQSTACIEGLEASTSVSVDIKKQLIGEAKFLRAFSYFYLVNLFGDIPLVTSTSYSINSTLPKTQQTGIYDQIISDLKDAQNLLTDDYVAGEKVRVNRLSATALLARAYLYINDWENAETQASIVINSGLYLPLPSLDSVFLKNSREAIFQLMPTRTGANTNEGNNFIPYSSPGSFPFYIIRPGLLNAFEANDNRKLAWVNSRDYLGQTYYYPFKYKVRDFSDQTIEYYMVLRVSEQYLIRAEARAHLNNLPGAEEDVNIIRARAGLGNLGFADMSSALLSIEQERRIELMAEWGHRWFDLKRMPSVLTTGKKRADDILAPIKPSWQPTDILYPVPKAEINNNPFLIQNEGY